MSFGFDFSAGIESIRELSPSFFTETLSLPLSFQRLVFSFIVTVQLKCSCVPFQCTAHKTFQRITTLNIHFTLLFSLFRQPMTLLLLLSIVRNIRHACNFLWFPLFCWFEFASNRFSFPFHSFIYRKWTMLVAIQRASKLVFIASAPCHPIHSPLLYHSFSLSLSIFLWCFVFDKSYKSIIGKICSRSILLYIGNEQKRSWRLFLIYHFIHISLHFLSLSFTKDRKKITLSSNKYWLYPSHESIVSWLCNCFRHLDTFSLAFHFGRS